MSLMASLVSISRMQQCLIDTYHEFLLLFYCCVLLEIKLITTTTTISLCITNEISNTVPLVNIMVFNLAEVHCTSISRPYSDVIMRTMASQITSPTIVYSGVYSGADQRKHQSSASLAFVRGIHRWLRKRGTCFHLMTSSCRHDAYSISSKYFLLKINSLSIKLDRSWTSIESFTR